MFPTSFTIDRSNEGIAIFSRYWTEVEAEVEVAEWREAQQVDVRNWKVLYVTGE
jgi:hypothetical protein